MPAPAVFRFPSGIRFGSRSGLSAPGFATAPPSVILFIEPTATLHNTPTVTQTPAISPTPKSYTGDTDTFIYDGDGKMVKSTVDGVTTYYPSAVYEKKNGVVTKYYGNGVMRVGGDVYYTLSNHIGSTSVTVDGSGTKVAEMHYTPWGEVKDGNVTSMQTDRTYTGQRTYADNFGLMYYNARWYDPEIGRFAQADSMVDGYDRYAYVKNNPINFADPTGHKGECYNEERAGHTIRTCTSTTPLSADEYLDRLLAEYGITLDGTQSEWTLDRKLAVANAAYLVGSKLAQTLTGGTATEAFKKIYGDVHFTWGGCNACEGSGAFSYGWQKNEGYYKIGIATMLDNGGPRGMIQMIHELGHTYDYTADAATGTKYSDTMPDNFFKPGSNRANILHPNGKWLENGDFYENEGSFLTQMHPPGKGNDSRGELFADMFVAWTLNVWNPNKSNADAVIAAQRFMPSSNKAFMP